MNGKYIYMCLCARDKNVQNQKNYKVEMFLRGIWDKNCGKYNASNLWANIFDEGQDVLPSMPTVQTQPPPKIWEYMSCSEFVSSLNLEPYIPDALAVIIVNSDPSENITILDAFLNKVILSPKEYGLFLVEKGVLKRFSKEYRGKQK